MPRSESAPVNPRRSAITAERAGRLYRILALLGTGPQTRAALIAAIEIDIRGFYRDLETIRQLGVVLTNQSQQYQLGESLDTALARLPFPDPQLNLLEVMQLVEGRTAAHRKLRASLEAFIGKRYRKRGT